MAMVAGFGLGLALIVAIGAQNVFVLRQGLRREHVGVVVLICAVSDAVLIAVAVGGVGQAVQAVPWLAEAARWGGAAFLFGYAVLAARRAWRPSDVGLTAEPGVLLTRTRVAPVALTALALTWLNPHVYLDTLFMLGSISTAYGDARAWFGVGAVAASFAWFTALGYGSRRLSGWLRTSRAWQLLDGFIAVVMFVLAAGLVLHR